jgi:hypothetical protein
MNEDEVYRGEVDDFDEGEPDLDRYESAVGWKSGKSPAEMLAEAKKKNPRAFNDPEMLFYRSVSEWVDAAVQGPPAGHLFGPFWQDEELAILFGGTGTGKSVLAIQIAEAVARGERVAPLIGPKRVLYLDFELNMTQYAMRYSVIGGGGTTFSRRYSFSPGLARAEMLWDGRVMDGYEGFSDMFFTNLDNIIVREDIETVVVDNITFLDRTSTSNANTSLNIMRSLQYIKKTRFIPILVLAHTPKRRPWVPLTELDLQGSVNLANFADSVFAVGRSRKSPDMRYLKHVKVRSGRPEYTESNVPVFSLEKYDFAAAQGRPLRDTSLIAEGSEEANNERKDKASEDTSRNRIDNAGYNAGGNADGNAGGNAEGDTRDFLGFRFVEFAHEEDHLETNLSGPQDNSRRPKHPSSLIRQAKKLAKEGKSFAAIANDLGIPKTTVRRYAANG